MLTHHICFLCNSSSLSSIQIYSSSPPFPQHFNSSPAYNERKRNHLLCPLGNYLFVYIIINSYCIYLDICYSELFSVTTKYGMDIIWLIHNVAFRLYFSMTFQLISSSMQKYLFLSGHWSLLSAQSIHLPQIFFWETTTLHCMWSW